MTQILSETIKVDAGSDLKDFYVSYYYFLNSLNNICECTVSQKKPLKNVFALETNYQTKWHLQTNNARPLSLTFCCDFQLTGPKVIVVDLRNSHRNVKFSFDHSNYSLKYI